MGTKGSDHETIPLCHLCHVEGWHRHGTLPGRGRDEWLERWKVQSEFMLAAYEAQGGRRAALVTTTEAAFWRERFEARFGHIEPQDNGPAEAAFAREATKWLIRNVWPLMPNGDEWSPLLTWHRGELLVQAEPHAGGEILDVEMLLGANPF